MTSPGRPTEHGGDHDREHWAKEFSSRLQDLRVANGNPSYRALARKALYSHTALVRAASGRNGIPSWELTAAFVKACGGELDQWKALHRFYTRRYEDGKVGVLGADSADTGESERPDPAAITTRAELATALRTMKVELGMSLRDIQQASMALTVSKPSKYSRTGLPVSTTSNMCNPRLDQFPEYEAVQVLLLVFGVPEDEMGVWRRAYHRARQHHENEREQARQAPPAEPGGDDPRCEQRDSAAYSERRRRYSRRMNMALAGFGLAVVTVVVWVWRLSSIVTDTWSTEYVPGKVEGAVWQLVVGTFVAAFAYTLVCLLFYYLDLQAQKVELARREQAHREKHDAGSIEI